MAQGMLMARHDDDGVAVDLERLADEIRDEARTAPAGRAARNLLPGPGAALTQSVMGLAAGRQLAEHDNPGVATLQVLRGRVAIRAGDEEVELEAGQWAPIPAGRHSVHSHADAAMLLTVAATAAR